MNKKLRTLCEGAVCVAASVALSYLKIPIGFAFGGFGGSVDLVMIPLIIFALRAGAGWGVCAGLVFGTVKFFFAGGVAVNWQSMLLDYSVAYAAVGLAGLCRSKPYEALFGSLLGCVARFVVHFISGVTIYAITGLENILGVSTSSAALYSLLYNGSYMIPNTVLAVVICVLIWKPLKKSVFKN